MSLYRQPGQARRRRRLALALGAAAVVVVVAVVVLVAGGGGPPSRAERVAAARSATTQALDGLELLEIEYPQAVRGGRVVAPTEYGAAKADVQRARDGLRSHARDLAALDSAAPREVDAALAHVGDAVAARAPEPAVRALVARARARIQAVAARG